MFKQVFPHYRICPDQSIHFFLHLSYQQKIRPMKLQYIFPTDIKKLFFLNYLIVSGFFCIFSAQNFRLGKSLPHMYGSEDIPLPQNAPPHLVPLSGDLLRYLSLGADGLPLLTTLKPGSTLPPTEDEWTDHDYVELPSH